MKINTDITMNRYCPNCKEETPQYPCIVIKNEKNVVKYDCLCCGENNEEIIDIKEQSDEERLLELLKYSQEAIDFWFGNTDAEQSLLDENEHFKEEVKYFIEKLSK